MTLLLYLSEEAGVNLNRNLSVEWKLPSPVNQLEDNSVSNPTQFVWQFSSTLIQKISDILRERKMIIPAGKISA